MIRVHSYRNNEPILVNLSQAHFVTKTDYKYPPTGEQANSIIGFGNDVEFYVVETIDEIDELAKQEVMK